MKEKIVNIRSQITIYWVAAVTAIQTYVNGRSLDKLVVDLFHDFKTEYQFWLSKARDMRNTNYKLAIEHFKKGNYSDTRLRFKIVTLLDKDQPEMYYYIGRGYMEEGKHKKAEVYFSYYLTLKHQEFHEACEYCLNVIRHDYSKITAVPDVILQHNFSLLSTEFDSIFHSGLENGVHQIFCNHINSALTQIGKPYGNKMLDLGCGTGLIGFLCKKNRVASSIVGVDFSQDMVNKAKECSVDGMVVYNEIELKKAIDYLDNCQEQFDLVTANFILGFEPDLQAFFVGVNKVLTAGGIFCLSYKVSSTNSQREFSPVLEDFSYSKEFIDSIVAQNNLSVISRQIHNMTIGDEEILVLQKAIHS